MASIRERRKRQPTDPAPTKMGFAQRSAEQHESQKLISFSLASTLPPQ
jgi:hypothetical protein